MPAIEPVARGYKSQCMLDWEESFGVAPTTPNGVILPLNTFSLNVSRALNSAATLTGRRDPVEPFDGNVEISGDIVVPVDTRAFGYWLKMMFGQPTTTAGEMDDPDNPGTPIASGVYTHVFQATDNCPSAIIQSTIGTGTTSYGKFIGVKATSMNISTGGDGELTATINTAGKDVTYSETNYQADATPIVMKRLNNFQAGLKKGDDLLSTVTQFDFTIDNGMDTSIRTIGGQGKLYDIVEGIMSVTGTASMLFTNLDMLQAAENSQELSLELSWEIDANNKLTFLFPEVRLQFQGPTIDGPTGIMTDYPFVAYYNDGAENTVCKVTLVNDVASY